MNTKDTLNIKEITLLFNHIKDAKHSIYEHNEIIASYEKNIEETKKKIKSLLPKGYWWSFDIDKNKLKKFHITKVYDDSICIKEPSVKNSRESYQTYYGIEKFQKLVIYKNEEEAKKAFYNRICPKCGNLMKDSEEPWCKDCMDKRSEMIDYYYKNNVYYCPEEDKIYKICYSDELTRVKGYDGQNFTIQIIDTGEIIHTDNLWHVYDPREKSLPHIKFLKEERQ